MEFSKKFTVGVLCGGHSSERAISLRSGKAVLEALGRSGIRTLRLDPKRPRQFKKLISKLQVAFIALHGRGGEDGSLQSRLERTGIPYVGSDPKASLLAFNKVEAKKVFDRLQIPTPPWTTFHRGNWRKLEKFAAPFVVKPIDNGSSIGVFLVEDFERSAEKIIHALKNYPTLLAEKRIVGREFTVGILGKKVLPVIELRPKGEFYDYRAKYTRGMTEYLVPAPLPPRGKKELEQLAWRVHQALGLRDFSRIDMVIDEKENPYVLEANTIPGFTGLSLLPKAAREAGISFERLCTRLVKMAWSRRDQNGKAKT